MGGVGLDWVVLDCLLLQCVWFFCFWFGLVWYGCPWLGVGLAEFGWRRQSSEGSASRSVIVAIDSIC